MIRRYARLKARKDCMGADPLTVTYGRKTAVNRRFVRNARLVDSLMR
ncbi:hypothetical protein [Lentzea sp. CA-135723]